jgi:tetratricopeptide (TPR) repeat protein
VDTSPNSWKLLYEAGRQALQNRKLQEAEQSFSAALQLAEDFAAGDPRLAATLNALARIYSLQRRYLAAAALLNRLLEVTERTLGPTHVQVAGVLTNLAEMYTHLGAAREELELRERVLGIRGDDPNADANSLLRLRERVAELQAQLVAQEISADIDEEMASEPLPTVRTAEYSAPITPTREPEMIVPEPSMTREPMIAREPVASPRIQSAVSRVESYAAQSEAERFSYDGDLRPASIPSPAVEIISIDDHPVLSPVAGVDHGFSDMGRDELQLGLTKKIGGRSSLYSIAAGVVLVAALLAARDYVKASDDERGVSAGSVSLAAAAPAPAVVTPVAQTLPAPAPAPVVVAPEPRTVERLIADRQAEREARQANQEREAGSRSPSDRPPRAPVIDLEKTFNSVDVAARAIDQRTKAATDSAMAIRLQAPTFKKIRIADPPQPQ